MIEYFSSPFSIALAMVTLGLAVFILAMAWPMMNIDSYRHSQAKELTGTFTDTLYGEVETNRDGVPDPRVAKGIAWDTKTKSFIAQGKISDEYLNTLLG